MDSDNFESNQLEDNKLLENDSNQYRLEDGKRMESESNCLDEDITVELNSNKLEVGTMKKSESDQMDDKLTESKPGQLENHKTLDSDSNQLEESRRLESESQLEEDILKEFDSNPLEVDKTADSDSTQADEPQGKILQGHSERLVGNKTAESDSNQLEDKTMESDSNHVEDKTAKSDSNHLEDKTTDSDSNKMEDVQIEPESNKTDDIQMESDSNKTEHPQMEAESNKKDTQMESDSNTLENKSMELDANRLEDKRMELDAIQLEDKTMESDSNESANKTMESEDKTMESDANQLKDKTMESDSNPVNDKATESDSNQLGDKTVESESQHLEDDGIIMETDVITDGEAERVECEVIVMEDDDDLVILEERPPPPKPPTDLLMTCEDEALDSAQRLKHEEEAKAFQKTMNLVKRWSIKSRLQTQQHSTIIMGSKSNITPACGSIGPLTRPPQPLQLNYSDRSRSLHVSQNFISARPVTSPVALQYNNLNSRPPISIVRQRSLAPRGKILVRPSSSPGLQRGSVQTTGASSVAPASSGLRPATGQIMANNQPQITLPTGQVVNMTNLVFDASSGLLIVPTQSPVSSTQLQATSTFSTANSIRGAVTSAGIGIAAPRIVSSTQRPSGIQVRPRVPIPTTRPTNSIIPNSQSSSFTPKIISTSSLNVRATRPNSVPTRYPPAAATQKPASSLIARPRSAAPVRTVGSTAARPPTPAAPYRQPAPVRATPTILNRATVSSTAQPRPTGPVPTRVASPPIRPVAAPSPSSNSKPIAQYSGKARPASARPPTPVNRPLSSVPQMETTNTINGTQADKDSNNNKTFPSLVVVIKPCLGDKITRQVLNAARSELDARVKALLLHSPAKLTEWLMQQGLLRLEHRCVLHMTSDRENIKYKLGMYSDGGKQPFSGGYVWITECCPDAQISVFHGSIFESAVYTPGTIMKLIYHWACQTSAQNVLQWVKVSSYYLKNFYTLLRSCCVAALHEYAPMMGGLDKFVEVGIITLGTPLNQVQPNQKPIKIEIVGVFDSAGKIVRMKVINPLGGTNVSSSQTRLQQILWPLKTWVDKDSTILIDNSIDKHSLSEMGFKSVIQSKNSTASGTQPTNSNVMNYLKHVIPKMFQNTLAVLSKSLIQQFLDELSWRELWGSTSAAAFDSMIHHLVQMTKWELDETLISRLNKISLNPFAEWSYTKAITPTGIDMLPDSIRGAGSGMPTLESYAAYVEANNGYASNSSSPVSPGGANKRKRKDENGTFNPVHFPEISNQLKRKADTMDRDELRRYLSGKLNDVRNSINLFGYYYAEAKSFSEKTALAAFPTNLKCPLCIRGFLTNQEIIRHIASHVYSVGRASAQVVYCEFCLKEMSNHTVYAAHLSEVHRQEHVPFPCYFCLDSFVNKIGLILHMWQTHEKTEMPYKCDCCNYRNSRHHEVVEHFNREHGGSDQVLCPICLKVFQTRSAVDMQNIVVHLQGHAGKKGKKCTQCVLTFVGDADVRAHAFNGAHTQPHVATNYSTLRSVQDKEILMPNPPKFTKSKILPPPTKKSKTANNQTSKQKSKDKAPHLAHMEKGVFCIESMKFYAHKGEDPDEVYNCCECKSDVLTPYHFPGCLTCAKCTFSTSCEKSMFAHNRNNHQVGRAAKGVSSMYTFPSSNAATRVGCECGLSPENTKDLIIHMKSCGNRVGRLLGSTTSEAMDTEVNAAPSKCVSVSLDLGCEEKISEEPDGGLLSGLGLRPHTAARI